MRSIHDLHDLMVAHSTKIANARYARMGELSKVLTLESTNVYPTVSHRWQKWYKLESYQETSVKVKATKMELDSQEATGVE